MCGSDPIRYARRLGVTLGEGCRILENPARVFGSEPYLITVGNHVSIAIGVRFITHDGGVWIFRAEHPELEVFNRIVVGNNVFIGINALILPQVTIGDDSVIGAGSVVTRSVPARTLAAGCPARPISKVEDYWAKIQSRASHIRSLGGQAKREAVLRHLEALGPNEAAMDKAEVAARAGF